MTAGSCSRTVRAAVFAALCVLLAALGHVMTSGTPVPWWAMAAGGGTTGALAWRFAGRERGPVPVASAAVAAQAALHASFSLAQALVHPRRSAGGSPARRWLEHLLCGSPAGPGTDGHGAAATAAHPGGHGTGADPLAVMAALGVTDHGTGDVSCTGMLAAHLLAALLSGLWLAHGERAAFRVLRALAAWLVAPLRPPLSAPVAPGPRRVRPRRSRADRKPRRLLLAHALTSRGPPAGVAVA
ncbi:hypothetical protein GCM10019016_109300 [Streptomyces prasinosporus]|uniref:PE-PGRS family protein n=1 Tax=Streptomyces prasinosporus TaxID=68256 RepID=A0ABP6UAT8_9ACTN